MKKLIVLLSILFATNISFAQCIDPDLIDPYGFCFLIYAPVCGCDGITYSNDCFAQTVGGVTSWTQGPCGSTSCIDPSIIDSNVNCSQLYQPVCGCDGNNYANDCISKFQFGVTQDSPGLCNERDCVDYVYTGNQPLFYQFYQSFILTSSESTVAINQDVVFQSQGTIELLNGFEVVSSANFVAEIADCQN